jgi:hypothetical protein
VSDRVRTLGVAVAVLVTSSSVQAAPAGVARKPEGSRCVATLDPQVWLVKTGGPWKQVDRYGLLRIVVLRKGMEHAMDAVQVQILEADDKANEQRLRACVDLEGPGLKAYVTDVTFTKVDDTHVAVGLDLEMKAMNWVVLREIYIVDVKAGAAKRVVEAKTVELD